MGSKIFAALGAAAALAMPAAATVVTFDSQASTNLIKQYGPTYQEADLTFTSGSDTPFSLFSWGANSFNADPDGATIASTTNNVGLTITATGGGVFAIGSIDLASAFNDAHGGSVNYTVTTSSGVLTGALTLAKLSGLQSFDVDWTNVLFATLSSSGGYQLDNVDYALGASSPTPELQSWALMAAGFGLLGARMRRARRHAAMMA